MKRLTAAASISRPDCVVKYSSCERQRAGSGDMQTSGLALAHLQADGGAADALVLPPAQETAHVALDGGRAGAHQLRAQLVQLRHLAGAQEHLRLAQLVALRSAQNERVSTCVGSGTMLLCAIMLRRTAKPDSWQATCTACEARRCVCLLLVGRCDSK